jgi:uncharacterized protein YbaA (DUF1428 family)
MTYVDGMIAPVKLNAKDDYIRFAGEMSAIFKDYGALSVVECWGVELPEGKLNSMNTAVILEADETVVFSWITWPSKEARDEGWGKMMADERMPNDMSAAPLDGKRLIFGGFEMVVEA